MRFVRLNNQTYSIRNNIKKLRQETGFSLDQIAKCIGLAKTSLYDIQEGRSCPNLATCYLISNFFNLHIEDVFYLFLETDEDSFPWGDFSDE